MIRYTSFYICPDRSPANVLLVARCRPTGFSNKRRAPKSRRLFLSTPVSDAERTHLTCQRVAGNRILMDAHARRFFSQRIHRLQHESVRTTPSNTARRRSEQNLDGFLASRHNKATGLESTATLSSRDESTAVLRDNVRSNRGSRERRAQLGMSGWIQWRRPVTKTFITGLRQKADGHPRLRPPDRRSLARVLHLFLTFVRQSFSGA